ncbi:MAG: T9SS type A sorting domain-containing protein [Bacteroidetes bacterium]|nr:T9SS type A sorting domain-containing protein [Bacteroidota bacterium]
MTKTATGCYKISNPIAVLVTCKEGEELTSNNISIYPNPTSGHLNINTDIMITAIKIFNNSGAVVQQITNWQGESIDVSQLASGIYYLQQHPRATTIRKIWHCEGIKKLFSLL